MIKICILAYSNRKEEKNGITFYLMVTPHDILASINSVNISQNYMKPTGIQGVHCQEK